MLRDRVLESIQKQASPLPPQTLRTAPRPFPSSRLSQRGTNSPSEKQSCDSQRPSVVHLSFASSFSPCHISQPPSNLLMILTIIAIHTPTVPRASVASAAASQTFPSMAPTARLPARVRRRYDIIEGTPRRGYGPSSLRGMYHLPYILCTQIPEFRDPNFPLQYPKVTHRLHPAYPAQQPHSRGRRLEYHDRFPSLSPSLSRSSTSLDRLAMDNNFTSPSSPPQNPKADNNPSVSASWCSAPWFVASNEDPVFRPSAFTFTLPPNVPTAIATLAATSCCRGCRTDTGPTRPGEASESTLLLGGFRCRLGRKRRWQGRDDVIQVPAGVARTQERAARYTKRGCTSVHVTRLGWHRHWRDQEGSVAGS
ncbi:hypothetical protein EDB84DRAFT_696940 [Lactarius hengduanensis]|nr:hypothetical protein EDB84DRAFT_696940 [Lactarius hengduanensis]